MNKTLATFLAVLGCSFCLSLQAAPQVLKVSTSRKVVAISPNDKKPWQVKDAICIYQGGVEAACGTVVKVIPQGALARIGSEKKTIAKGDTVGLAKGRRTASSEISTTASPSSPKSDREWEFAAGVGGGTSYFYPVLNVQRRLSNNWAIGAVPFFVSSSSASNTSVVTAYGASLTLNYYLKKCFEGLWFQVGGGAAGFSVNTSGATTTSISGMALATVGYRLEITSNINIGAALGGLYVSPLASSTVIISLSGILPYGMVDAGFSF